MWCRSRWRACAIFLLANWISAALVVKPDGKPIRGWIYLGSSSSGVQRGASAGCVAEIVEMREEHNRGQLGASLGNAKQSVKELHYRLSNASSEEGNARLEVRVSIVSRGFRLRFLYWNWVLMTDSRVSRHATGRVAPVSTCGPRASIAANISPFLVLLGHKIA